MPRESLSESRRPTCPRPSNCFLPPCYVLMFATVMRAMFLRFKTGVSVLTLWIILMFG